MRFLLPTGLLMALVMGGWTGRAGADEPPTDAVRKDRKAIEGTWKVVLMVEDGKQSKPEDASKVFVVNGDDGTWSLHADGKVIAKGPSTIDPLAKPRRIDFYIQEENGKRQEFLGIYEMGDMKRKLCFAPSAKGRPGDFESKKGTGYILVEFERIKK